MRFLNEGRSPRPLPERASPDCTFAVANPDRAGYAGCSERRHGHSTYAGTSSRWLRQLDTDTPSNPTFPAPSGNVWSELGLALELVEGGLQLTSLGRERFPKPDPGHDGYAVAPERVINASQLLYSIRLPAEVTESCRDRSHVTAAEATRPVPRAASCIRKLSTAHSRNSTAKTALYRAFVAYAAHV